MKMMYSERLPALISTQSTLLQRALFTEHSKKKLKLTEPKNFTYVAGKGVQGKIHEKQIFGGNRALMESRDINTSLAEKDLTRLSSQGKTVIFVASANRVEGLVALSFIASEKDWRLVTRSGYKV